MKKTLRFREKTLLTVQTWRGIPIVVKESTNAFFIDSYSFPWYLELFIWALPFTIVLGCAFLAVAIFDFLVLNRLFEPHFASFFVRLGIIYAIIGFYFCIERLRQDFFRYFYLFFGRRRRITCLKKNVGLREPMEPRGITFEMDNVVNIAFSGSIQYRASPLFFALSRLFIVLDSGKIVKLGGKYSDFLVVRPLEKKNFEQLYNVLAQICGLRYHTDFYSKYEFQRLPIENDLFYCASRREDEDFGHRFEFDRRDNGFNFSDYTKTNVLGLGEVLIWGIASIVTFALYEFTHHVLVLFLLVIVLMAGLLQSAYYSVYLLNITLVAKLGGKIKPYIFSPIEFTENKIELVPPSDLPTERKQYTDSLLVFDRITYLITMVIFFPVILLIMGLTIIFLLFGFIPMLMVVAWLEYRGQSREERLEHVGYCGLFCGKCPALDENEFGQREVETLAKELERHPEEVQCHGCRTYVGMTSIWTEDCPIKGCAKSKNVEICIQCKEYPCEDKLLAFINQHHPHPVNERRRARMLTNQEDIIRQGIDNWLEEQKKSA